MIDSMLDVMFWIGCLTMMVIETRSCVSRSAELKLAWLVETTFQIFQLRIAILNFAKDPQGAGALQLAAATTFFSAALSCAGLLQTTAIAKDSDAYGRMPEDDQDACEQSKISREQPSWASIALFSWINKTLARAYTGRIAEEELRPLAPEERSDVRRDELLEAWKSQTNKTPEDPKLWKALVAVFGFDFFKAALLRLIALAFDLVGPLLLQQLVASIEGSARRSDDGLLAAQDDFAIVRVDGIMIAVAIGLSKVTGMIISEQWVASFISTNHQIRGSLTGMIFRKAFMLSAKGRQGYKIGEMISLMSVDASRLGHSLHGLHMLWSAPMMVIVSTFFLYSMLGSSVFAGLSVMLVFAPLNIWVAKLQGRLNKQVMKVKDERSNLMDEVVQGIRIIKYFVWERNFEAKVSELRDKELALIWQISLCTTYLRAISGGSTMLVALVAFATYTLGGQELKPSIAFGALALFKVMEHPLQVLGHLIDMVVEGRTALGRLRDFFLADEIDRHYYANSGDFTLVSDDSVELDRTEAVGKAVEIVDATFSWPKYEEPERDPEANDSSLSLLASFGSMLRPNRDLELKTLDTEPVFKVALKDISLDVKPGTLCMVSGKVGAGKTSLLSAMLGEICKDRGQVTLNGKVAYAPQQPWIFNASVRQNILFGSALDPARYARVLEVCALQQDLLILPAGDETEIGEKGVNLSGGQKARISLARAVYQKADVYLLDDPLSAVDVHVSKTMFHDCIRTFLAGSTRVLVTHQVQYMPGADTVVHLEDGNIVAHGPPEEVLGKCPHLQVGRLYENREVDEEDESERRGSEDSSADTKASDCGESRSGPTKHDVTGKRSIAQTTEEEMLADAVALSIWKKYALALGEWWITACFLVLLLSTLLALASGWWLSVWTTAEAAKSSAGGDSADGAHDEELDPPSTQAHPTMFYIVVFAVINLGSNLAYVGQSLIERLAGLKAAAALHDRMLATILRAPVEFFDTTPSGRVLNRFTSDVHQLDRDVSARLNSFVSSVVQGALLCVAIAVVNPVVLVVALPTAGMFLAIQRLFKRGCLQLQRLESIAKSPLFAHFSESLNGVSTIRAFGAERGAMAASCTLTDALAVAWVNLIDCHQWLTVRVVSLASLVIFATAVAAVLVATPTAASAAATGLVITYAFQLTGVLTEAVRAFTHSEQSLVSVERVDEYGSMAREDDAQRQQQHQPQQPPPHWPSDGKVEFDNVQMTYRLELPPALKGLSFATKAGEKIGVVGRTGAGKSSLAASLFRLGHITAGAVRLDGVDVATLGVEALRTQLSIIPQDPVLFSGTIRSNLDPFNAHDDAQVWRALECVHMKELVAGFRSGLDHHVAQGGTNLSTGQRQLFCLARALLRRAKVIVMDEATASVDLETDTLIQDTVRTHFKASTVLTIAHRLNTVMSCDRVLVLGDGRVLEMGAPHELAQDPSTVFYKMVSDPKAETEMLG